MELTDRMRQHIRSNYGGADVWLKGVQVMEGGLLIGQKGQDWWEQKIEAHRKWMRWKRMKEGKV